MKMPHATALVGTVLGTAFLLVAPMREAAAYPLSATVVGDEPAAGAPFDLLVAGEKPTPCYDIIVDLDASGPVDDDVPTVRIAYTLQNTASSCITVIEPYEFTYGFEDGLPEGTYVVELLEGTDVGPSPPVVRELRSTFTVGPSTGEVPADAAAWSTIKHRLLGRRD